MVPVEYFFKTKKSKNPRDYEKGCGENVCALLKRFGDEVDESPAQKRSDSETHQSKEYFSKHSLIERERKESRKRDEGDRKNARECIECYRCHEYLQIQSVEDYEFSKYRLVSHESYNVIHHNNDGGDSHNETHCQENFFV